jgi:hypothetical protein
VTARITVANLSDVLAGLQAQETLVNNAASYAIQMAGLAVERQAKQNASGRPGPNVRTGNLRRSITTSMPVKGFEGKYTITVSATMVYARAVELGHPKWKPGVKYPYLGPAANTLKANGTLNRVFTGAFASKMRG